MANFCGVIFGVVIATVLVSERVILRTNKIKFKVRKCDAIIIGMKLCFRCDDLDRHNS